MIGKFDTFKNKNLIDKIKNIEYILKDEGVCYSSIEDINRKYWFPKNPTRGISKSGIKFVLFRVKLKILSSIRLDELSRHDFFNEWLDRVHEICGPKTVSIFESCETFVGPSIYIYYNN